MAERPVVFDCEGSQLLGILHEPGTPARAGMLIVVAGGPQFRVGAHRQFIALGRQMAAAGMPTLRFDHRGTGDSEGECKGFLDMGADIGAAIDVFFKEHPSLERVVIWGECESASAAAFYAHNDDRVDGIFMVNPWVRTEAGQAQTYLKHYYWERLRDPEFWHKVKSGDFSLLRSVKGWLGLVSNARKGSQSEKRAADEANLVALPLPERLTRSLILYSGRVYVLTSGNDYIAQEFKDFIGKSALWQNSDLNQRIEFSDMADADHTFSRSHWREQLFTETRDWSLLALGK